MGQRMLARFTGIVRRKGASAWLSEAVTDILASVRLRTRARVRTEVVIILQQTEAGLRTDITAMEDRHTGTSARLRSEKSLLENELAQTRRGERDTHQQDIARLKREAEESWDGERVENAPLRERINDIATEVARLTMVLEGADSPIETMLASEFTTA